jgi:uncharacterized membrane protein YhaH (DUF805 family)
MDNETRQVVYRLVSTVLGSLALLASLLAIHAHRWLAADAPGAFVAGVTDAAVVTTVRVGAAAAFLLCLAHAKSNGVQSPVWLSRSSVSARSRWHPTRPSNRSG